MKALIMSVIALAIGLILVVGVIILISFEPEQENPPTEMAGLNFLDEDTHFTVYFGLNDVNGDFVRADGSVTTTIRDNVNVELYNTTFALRSSQFKWFRNILGDKVLAYRWEIPYSDVNKTYGTGLTLSGSITFRYKDRYITGIDSIVGLPDALKTTISDRINVTVNDYGKVPDGFRKDDVYVNVTVENICPIQLRLWGAHWKVETENATVYSWRWDDPSPPDELASGASFTWMIYFSVPLDEDPVKIIYHDELEINL